VQEHVIELPKMVVVGRGVRRYVAKYLLSLGTGKKCFVVSGCGATRGIAKEVAESLMDGGFEVSQICVSSAHVDEVDRVELEARSYAPDVILGVGGGKAIDVAKVVAYRLRRHFVSIPTAPSHDGIASPFASVKGFERPTSVRTTMPILVVADVEVISRAPRRLIVAGCGDLIGKFSAILDWRLAHRLRGEYYGEYAASLALLSAKHALRAARALSAKKIPEEAVRTLVEALISSGVAMGIAGSTRPASGSEHMFAHALDIVANYPALHGEEVGVGTIMMLYLHGSPMWRKVRKVLRRMGAPTTAKELGVRDVDIIEALVRAHTVRPERYTILGEKGLSWEAAERLARVTGVID